MSEARDLAKRLRMQFPLAVCVQDVFTGQRYTIERENLLEILTVDSNNALLESQTLPAFYAEMARAHASLKSKAAEALANLKRWKAQKRAECRAQAEKAHEKAPSKDLQDDFYRTHAEYSQMNRDADESRVQAELLEDLKHAFELKQRSLKDIHGVVFGHNRVQRVTDDNERLEELAEASRPMMNDAAGEMDDLLQGRLKLPGASDDDDAPPAVPAVDAPATTKKPRTVKGSTK